MCTVTYLPLGKNGFILTSSRDVPYSRQSAELLKEYSEDDLTLWYPKDGDAGGTWIGTSSRNRLICLLNGGFTYHTSRAKYRHSRGLIVKDLLKTEDIKCALDIIDLMDIEQFTLAIVDWNNGLELIEFVWDGKMKHVKVLPQLPRIWSSSTLYDESIKQLREDWFKKWQEQDDFSQENILEFHHSAGIGDPYIDVMMDRGMGGTVSITSVKKSGNNISMYYKDIRNRSGEVSLKHKSNK